MFRSAKNLLKILSLPFLVLSAFGAEMDIDVAIEPLGVVCRHNATLGQHFSRIDAFIDSFQCKTDKFLKSQMGNFLHPSIVTGVLGQPKDHSRDAFKAALRAYVEKDLESLSVVGNVSAANILEAVSKYLNNLMPVGTTMLHCSVESSLNKYGFVHELTKALCT